MRTIPDQIFLNSAKKAAYFPIREILEAEKEGKRVSVPRPLTQLDLEKVLATSKKTQVAASEYTGLSSQSSVWGSPSNADEVQAAINGISKLFVSQLRNIQPDSQDSYQQHPSEGDSE